MILRVFRILLKRAGIPLILFGLLSADSLSARPASFSFECLITGADSGDLLIGLTDNISVRIRVGHIICPKYGDADWEDAKELSLEKALNRRVTVLAPEPKKSRRVRGEVILPNGEVLSNILVESGLCRSRWKR